MLHSTRMPSRLIPGSLSALLLFALAGAPAFSQEQQNAVTAEPSVAAEAELSVNAVEDIDAVADVQAPVVAEPIVVTDRVIVSNGVVGEGQVMLIGDKKQWDTFVGADPIASASGYLAVEPDADRQAIEARWNGKGEAQFFVAHESPIDYTEDLARSSALVVLLQVLDKPKKKVLLRMGCGYPCASNADITKLLKALPREEWIRLSFDLKCFVDGGLNAENVDTPLLITTKGKMGLLISDVRVTPGMGSEATISCQ